MHRQIFVNLPVQDLDRSRAFFSSLGFEFNPAYSDDKALCMVLHENIFVMLLTEPFFQTFTRKPVADAHSTTEVLVALSCETRQQVDDLVARARAAGGGVPREPQDHGFMYAHAFEDLDGHIWEWVAMAPQGQDA